MTAPGQQEMTRGDLELDETRPVRDALRAAFRAPDGVRVRLHRGGRPAWLMEMGWDGTETVSCGDRFYGAPDRDGLTLVAYSTDDFRTGYPVGYLSASLSSARGGPATAHLEMIQVDADFRGERVGSALTAALAELILREIDQDPQTARDLGWEFVADTQAPAADALVRRLQGVIDEACDPDPEDDVGVTP